MLKAELDRISNYSINNRRVENLAHLINVENLLEIHKRMDGKKATGVDKVTKEEYGENVQENLRRLTRRMKSQSYYPQPSRRVYIEKPGSKKERPLGISSYEDKPVQRCLIKGELNS